MSRTQLLAVGLILAISFFTRHLLADAWSTNQYALQTIRDTQDSPLPWKGEHVWWETSCISAEISDSIDNGRAKVEESSWKKRYFDAVQLVSVGRCNEAINLMESIAIEGNLRQPMYRQVKAYTYGSLANFTAAAKHHSKELVSVGDWDTRRYWANVFFRAAIVTQNMELREDLLTYSADMPYYFPLYGDLDLVTYLERVGRYDEATDELKRASAYPMGVSKSDLYLYFQELQDIGEAFLEWSDVWIPLDNVPELTYRLDREIDDDWTFSGVIFEVTDLAKSPWLSLEVYWCQESSAKCYMKETVAYNMFPDAGFESYFAHSDALPAGYTMSSQVSEYPYPFSIEAGLLDSQRYCVFGETDRQYQIMSPSMSAEQNEFYLIGGEVYSEDTFNGLIGWRSVNLSGEVDRWGYINTETTSASENGKAFVDVITVSLNETKDLNGLLLSDGGGKVCFDNVFMMAIPSPVDLLR